MANDIGYELAGLLGRIIGLVIGIAILALVVWIAYILIKKLIQFGIAEYFRIKKLNEDQQHRD